MKNKGITLVALVITTVIILIMSGVALNLVVGENGLITKAKETKNVYDNAVAKDQEMQDRLLAYIEDQTEDMPDLETLEDDAIFCAGYETDSAYYAFMEYPEGKYYKITYYEDESTSISKSNVAEIRAALSEMVTDEEGRNALYSILVESGIAPVYSNYYCYFGGYFRFTQDQNGVDGEEITNPSKILGINIYAAVYDHTAVVRIADYHSYDYIEYGGKYYKVNIDSLEAIEIPQSEFQVVYEQIIAAGPVE